MFSEGGYDDGYRMCPCFWGKKPGSLVALLEKHLGKWQDLHILDIGCGEGKNAIYLARLGAKVDAIDISAFAIANAKRAWTDKDNVNWIVYDIRQMKIEQGRYDVVILYGILHCLKDALEITEIVTKTKDATKTGGFHIVCSFNERTQDLTAHPDFSPILVRDSFYLSLYSDWSILYHTDEDLIESHPHNDIEHVHSMTRIIAEKQK